MSAPTTTPTTSGVDRWFHLTERGSTNGREIRGGLVTFFTMAYIVILNPLIIGTAKDRRAAFIGGSEDVVTSIAQVTAATALVAGLLTIAMGVFGRFPVALAAGLGINGVVAFALAPQMTWADAMGLVVLEGILITILVLTGFRTAVFHAVPEQLKYAIGVGIGLFITIIGFVDAGITRTGVPLITFGNNGALRGWPAFVFVFGLLLTAVLVAQEGPRRDPHRHRRDDGPGDHHRGDREVGPQTGPDGKVVNPNGWSLNVPACPDSSSRRRTSALLGHVSLFGGFSAIGFVGGVARGLLAHAQRLLRHDGHGLRPGQRGRDPRGGRRGAALRGDPARRLGRRGRRRCREHVEQHQLHRVGVGRR